MDTNKKILQSLILSKSRPEENGFTLLELLLVVVFLGVLTSFALPNFIGQVGKAREAEVRMLLGTIGRAQQAFHYERKTFATSYEQLAGGTGDFSSKYITLQAPVVTGDIAKHKALAVDPEVSRVRNFSLGVYYLNGGYYDINFCRSFEVSDDVDVGDTPEDPCSNNGVKLQ